MSKLSAFHNEEAGVSLYQVNCIPFMEEIARKHTKVDFLSFLKQIPGYEYQKIYYQGNLVARCFKKHQFYIFLKEHDIDWEKIISKKLLPDNALLGIIRETLFIIGVKYQQGEVSVDEKLQTCDFNRKQYLKLVASLPLKVEYVYVLIDWFNNPKYKDVLDYIHSVNCHYKFKEPLLQFRRLDVYLYRLWVGFFLPAKAELFSEFVNFGGDSLLEEDGVGFVDEQVGAHFYKSPLFFYGKPGVNAGADFSVPRFFEDGFGGF